MIPARFVRACFLLLAAVHPLLGASDAAVSEARAVFQEVNSELKKLQRTAHTVPVDTPAGELDVTVWRDGGTIRKMAVGAGGEHGTSLTEYYYAASGDLVFAYQLITTEHIETGQVVNRSEHRHYFSGGQMVKWLDPARDEVDPGSEMFTQEAERLFEVESTCRAAVDGGSQHPAGTVLRTGSTRGTFVMIEQGDYFHFTITDEGGETVSFLLLDMDPSVEPFESQPETFEGKPVTVHWEDRMVDIPEAGGVMEMRVCTKVER